MRQLKKATSGVTPPFLIAQAPRVDEILLTCLHDAEDMVASMPACLLHGPLRKAVSKTQRHDSPSSPSSRSSFANRIQMLLEKKFDPLKQFLKTHGEPLFLKPAGLTRTARLREAAPRVTELKSTDRQQALLKRIDFLERELAEAKARITHTTDWVPLIKAPAAPAHRNDPHRNAPNCNTSDRNARDETRARSCANFDLAGRCILCVGGRAKLYPEYRRLVETSGGSLLIYRSGLKNDADILSTLFDCADMVVCPADCVNHDAYFAVKRYCKRSGKACVLLDRSNLPTFRKGVETLAALVAPPIVAR